MNRIFGILVLCLVGCAPAFLLCQAPPDLGKGLKPFTVYNSTAIDNVNMTNGNVYVHIPLLSYPQRGKALDLSFSIFANARVWGCGWLVSPYVGEQASACTWAMAGSGAAAAAGPYFVGAGVGSDQQGMVGATLNYLPCYVTPGSQCSSPSYAFWNYAYYSADGGVHNFYSGVGSLSGENGYIGGGYPAVDGSGYSPTPSQSFHGPVVDRHGVGVGGGIQTDADGNELTLSSQSGIPANYTDTLNRIIPDPVVGSMSASIANCPASALAGSAAKWTVPGPSTANGGQEIYYLCYRTIMPSPVFLGHPFILPTVAPIVLVALVLPDQTFYQFAYNDFLELTQIKLPTGGIVNYVFADIALFGNDFYRSRVLYSRTTIDGVNPPATTHYTWLQSETVAPGVVGSIHIQTDPLGNDEVHFIDGQNDGKSDDIRTDSYQGCSSPSRGTPCVGTGQLMKSVERVYQTLSPATATMLSAAGGTPTKQSRIVSETTTLPSSTGTTLVSQKRYTFVPPQVTFQWWTVYSQGQTQTCWHCGEFNQIRSVEEDDYGNGATGPLLKTTTTYYKWEDQTPSGNSTVGAQYLLSSLVDLPWYVRVVGANNFEETDYWYDETAPVPSSITTQAGGYLLGSVRGHLTSVSRALNNGGRSGRLPKNPADPTTTTVWYDTGVPYQTVDANGNPPTTYSYDPYFYGGYLTKTVGPIGNSVSATYDYNTGAMTSFTDVNSATTTYTYDALVRPLSVHYPDGGEHDVTYNVTSTPGNVVVKDSIDSRFDQHTIVFDGFGRETQTQHNTDLPSASYVDTAYDANGHPWSVSNPYRSKTDPLETTRGVTYTFYDALGRATGSLLSDGTSTTATSYSGMPYTWLASTGNATYYGLSKTYSDPDGNKTVWASDALGRLGATVENSIGAKNLPALTTIYLYDTLNNLANVEQQGDGTNSGAFRNRTFGHDNLSRLVYSLNPETGAISYKYDLNSNLIKKTDARNTVTTYQYDALNRLTSKTYTSDAAHTPSSCYQYGTVAGSTLERLTMEWTEAPSSTPCLAWSNSITSRAFSAYDLRGRILNEQQCVGQSCSLNVSGNNTYSYDRAGHLLNFGNLIGTGLFTNNYDSAGRLSSLSESWSGRNAPLFPSTLFSGTTYAPHGALAAATYGTNLTILRTYDSRLRILGETDFGTTVQQPALGSSGRLTIMGGEQTK